MWTILSFLISCVAVDPTGECLLLFADALEIKIAGIKYWVTQLWWYYLQHSILTFDIFINLPLDVSKNIEFH